MGREIRKAVFESDTCEDAFRYSKRHFPVSKAADGYKNITSVMIGTYLLKHTYLEWSYHR